MVYLCGGSLLGPHRKLRLKGGFRRWWGSMFGRNKRDGAAENPVAPKHFAGGAASGSGVAVASNDVDFALGMYVVVGHAPAHEIKFQSNCI